MFNAAAFSGVSFCTVISSNHLFASGPEKSAHWSSINLLLEFVWHFFPGMCDLAIFRTWSVQILINWDFTAQCLPRSLVIDIQCSQLRSELSCHPTKPCIILSKAVVLHILIRTWMSVVFAQARFCWKSFALFSISKTISKTNMQKNTQSSPNQMQVWNPRQQFCKRVFESFHRQSFLETMAQPGVMDSKAWEVLDQDGKNLVQKMQLSRCFVSNHHFLNSNE